MTAVSPTTAGNVGDAGAGMFPTFVRTIAPASFMEMDNKLRLG